ICGFSVDDAGQGEVGTSGASMDAGQEQVRQTRVANFKYIVPMPTPKSQFNQPQGKSILRSLWTRLKEHPLARVGPGLITGVADDDPSGIATYSQAGAQFGLNM